MSGLFDLIGGEDISVEERWKILDVLYDPKPVFIATAAVLLASLFGWFNGLPGWAAGWSASSLFILAMRLFLSQTYRNRPENSSQHLWKIKFLLSSFLTGLQWGWGALVFLYTTDSSILCTVFAIETALLAGASARGCCFPAAALLQVTAVSVIIVCCTALAGLWVFVCLMILLVAYYTAFVQSLSSMNLMRIISDEQRKVLVASLARTNAEIAVANARLQEMSLTDALTGIANRRCFDQEVAVCWAQAVRQHTSIALLFIDVDHFKHFNDSYGHLAGDACLSLVAAAIKSAVRGEADRVSRYGGEEFAILLVDTDAAEAVAVAGRVAHAVRSSHTPIDGGRYANVTVSIGVAAMIPEQNAASAMLVSLADHAVYEAKQAGRNCIRLSGQSEDRQLSVIEAVTLAPAQGDSPPRLGSASLRPRVLGAA